METIKQKASQLLIDFKGDHYVSGINVFDRLGTEVAKLGQRVAVVIDSLGQDWVAPLVSATETSLQAAGLILTGSFIPGAKPNAPKEDVFRIARAIGEQNPDALRSDNIDSVIEQAKSKCATSQSGKV